MRTVVGVAVEPALVEAWACWLAPEVQPFFVDDVHEWPGAVSEPAGGLTPELRDTYKVWRLRDRDQVVWLDEATFMGLDRKPRQHLVRLQADRGRGAVPSVRAWRDLLDAETLRGQADGQRFVWWPSIVLCSPGPIVERFVTDEADSPRHHAVPASTWGTCAAVLPGARVLAGTYGHGSGPNCFGTVMAAAGVSGAADQWMQERPFEERLSSACIPGGADDEPGTILVWRRSSSGLPVHAAVTIGAGYALEKASQTWWTPRIVAPVDEIKRASRAAGQRLERHRVVHR